MNKLITTTSRKTLARSFTVMLALAAMTAVTAGVSTARAWDQQATEAQMDNELNHQATGGYARHLSGGYARHPSGPYASAHPHARSSGISMTSAP